MGSIFIQKSWHWNAVTFFSRKDYTHNFDNNLNIFRFMATFTNVYTQTKRIRQTEIGANNKLSAHIYVMSLAWTILKIIYHLYGNFFTKKECILKGMKTKKNQCFMCCYRWSCTTYYHISYIYLCICALFGLLFFIFFHVLRISEEKIWFFISFCHFLVENENFIWLKCAQVSHLYLKKPLFYFYHYYFPVPVNILSLL